MPDESNIDGLFSDGASDPGDRDGSSERSAGPLSFTCSRCGKKSSSDEPMLFCPHCGAPVQAGGGSDAIRVLLVDDAAIARKKIGAILKSLGCSVVEAVDGKDALAKADSAKPQLIILDINMPGMTGLQVLDELRRQPEFQSTRIVMLTAEADSAVVVQALKRQANDYLRKDARVDQLKERLLKHLGHIRAAAD